MSITESSPKAGDPLSRLRIPRRDEPRRPSAAARQVKWSVGRVLLAALGAGGLLFWKQKGLLGA
jgi:hypothetical protein